jgi:hypothetical protein
MTTTIHRTANVPSVHIERPASIPSSAEVKASFDPNERGRARARSDHASMTVSPNTKDDEVRWSAASWEPNRPSPRPISCRAAPALLRGGPMVAGRNHGA